MIEFIDTVAFMMEAHKGQFDKNGKSYWLHPVKVFRILNNTFEEVTQEESEAAILHDIIEDTDYTEADLLGMGYSKETVDIIMLVSKLNNKPHRDYVNKIIRSNNISAMKVKLSDILHNLDSKRLSKLDDATVVRLKKKYDKSKIDLISALNDNGVVFKFPCRKVLGLD